MARGTYTGYPTPEPGRPPVINEQAVPVATCAGEVAPKLKSGSSPAKPSALEFDSDSGKLNCKPFGEGTTTGKLKLSGYNEEEVISAN